MDNFEVVDELILGFGFEAHFVHGEFVRLNQVQDLTVGYSGPELFDFGVVCLGEVVDPAEEIVTGGLVQVGRGQVVNHLNNNLILFPNSITDKTLT